MQTPWSLVAIISSDPCLFPPLSFYYYLERTMKFGTQLKKNLNPEWRFYYVDYTGLKKLLKQSTKKNRPFTEEDEAYFSAAIDRDLKNVYGFQNVKVGEIGRRVQHCDSIVEDLIAKDDSSPVAWSQVEKEVNTIIAEVNELAKFTRLNYSAFVKIVKKHDKHTGIPLKEGFINRLNERPFYKDNYDSIVLQLSRLYEIVRNRGLPANTTSAGAMGGAQNFVRRTTKYWVHPDNVMEVKCVILKYLPVLVYNSKSDRDAADPAITSIYYDSDQFELYKGRVEKSEGAEAIRLRWYGPTSNQEIFVERKTHHEDWTGESSVKQRFPLKEKYVNAFFRGEYTVEKAVAKMRERDLKSDQEIAAFEKLATEIQQTVLSKALKPTIRSFYNRTAFQLPGDARVRISLDTELSLIREDNLDGVSRSGENWRRRDIGTDFPFTQLPENDICRFPYAILEVKLQTQHGTEPPKWVQDLTESHLVEEVPKFSKFIHGVATLLESRVSLLPFWLPQMDKDIRKLPTHDFRISRAGAHWALGETANKGSSESTAALSDSESMEDEAAGVGTLPKVDEVRLSIDEENGTERTPLLSGANGGGDSGTFPQKLGRVFQRRNRKRFGFRTLQGFFKRRFAMPSQYGNQPASGLAADKRIAVPVRVEPKVFFANERTFLSWLHFAVLVGSLAISLVNYGDRAARVAGVLFTLIAIGIMIYGLMLYQWRAEKIRKRERGTYDDLYGPVVLAITIFAAVSVNVIMKLSAA